MEFKAIVDAKARDPSGCAVVGVYENGDLGVAARQIDTQIGGLIGQLHAGGDFAAKLGDTLLLPQPAGAAAARVLLVGLGARSAFGRKQYRKALQSSAQALAKTGANDAIVYLALEEVPGLELPYRARIVAEVFCAQAYRIPDLKTGAKPKPPKLASGQRGGGECAGRQGGGRRASRSAPRSAAALASVARSGEPAAQHLYAHLYRHSAPQALAKEWPQHQDQGAGRETASGP